MTHRNNQPIELKTNFAWRLCDRLTLLGCLLALTPALGGCGDDDDAETESTESAPPAEAPAAQAPAAPAGAITLAPGFNPDPHVLSGRAGGGVEASSLNQQCAGWISQDPNHVVQADAAFTNLVVAVNAGTADTTLVVQLPDGSYRCNDDEDGTNPMVSGAVAQGIAKIWIGTYERDQNVAYTLGISELPTTRPSTLTPPAGTAGVTIDGTESNFGTITLASGFGPAPQMASGNSGGAVNISALASECAGWVSAQPDHMLVAESDFTTLRILVKSDEDTTLVVRKPDGTYACNDDAEELNPIVEGAFPAGTYRVWIGSYEQGTNSNYKLGVTTDAAMTVANLP